MARYWRNRDCFDDAGRCYLPDTGEVVIIGSAAWGLVAVIFAWLALRAWWKLLP